MTSLHVLMTADAVGGVWTYTLELARALAAYGVRTTIATLGPRPDAAQRTAAAVIPGVDLIETDFALEWMEDGWRDAEAAADWLLALEQHLRPAVVHLNGFTHGALPWRAPAIVVGHSCVLSWHEAVGGEFKDGWLERYRSAVARGLRAADSVVAPTASMLSALDRLYGPLRSKSVIPNGRDPLRFVPQEKTPLIVSAGRLWDRAKNIDAVHAIESRLSWPVAIAGDVSVGCGRLSEQELADLLGRAAIAVLPARYEPFGLLPLEAALAGCALVLGDIPSLREVWGNAATYVDPEDHEALLAAIESLIADPDERRRSAWRARRRALSYSPADMARRYLWIYRSLSGGFDADPWRLACAS
jgi:glycogen(starch) synthase